MEFQRGSSLIPAEKIIFIDANIFLYENPRNMKEHETHIEEFEKNQKWFAQNFDDILT